MVEVGDVVRHQEGDVYILYGAMNVEKIKSDGTLALCSLRLNGERVRRCFRVEHLVVVREAMTAP